MMTPIYKRWLYSPIFTIENTRIIDLMYMRKTIGACEIYAILLETWKLSGNGHDNEGRITPQKHYPIAQTLHFPHLVQRGYHLVNVKTSCYEPRAFIIVLYLSKNHKQAFSQYVPYKICKATMWPSS